MRCKWFPRLSEIYVDVLATTCKVLVLYQVESSGFRVSGNRVPGNKVEFREKDLVQEI